MKRFFFIIVTTVYTLTTYSQTNEETKCDKIIFNDSLFNQQTDQYNFDIVTGNIVHNVLKYQIQDINEIITVDNDCLKFKISYSCGCGPNEKKLVTNGQLRQDNKGRNYYEIKFLFTNFNKGCEALCHDRLSFDISELKNHSTDIYLKFDGFDQLIKYRQ